MSELFNSQGWRVTLDTAPLPDGREKTMVRVHRCDAVHIIALPTPKTVLMLREFRPHYGTYIWMLPSGKVDKEDEHATAAQRELQEETGMRAEEIQHWFTAHHSEGVAIGNHVYIARGLTPDPLPQDPGELIEVHELPFEEALENVLQSEKLHTISAMALLRYLKEKA